MTQILTSSEHAVKLIIILLRTVATLILSSLETDNF